MKDIKREHSQNKPRQPPQLPHEFYMPAMPPIEICRILAGWVKRAIRRLRRPK